MATVPMDPSVDLNANPMGRFVAPDVAAPAVQQGPDYTGKQAEALGAAMINSGSAVIKIAERIQDSIDDANTTKFDNKTAEYIRKKQTEYLFTKGQDAITGYKAVDEDLSKFVAGQMDSLDNDMQRKMYGKVAERRLQAARASMNQHQLKELQQWELGEKKDRVTNLMMDAIDNAPSYKVRGGIYDERKLAMQIEVGQVARLLGIVDSEGNVDTKSEQYKSMLREANTALHTKVLSSAINNDQLDFARDYLKKFRPEISPDQLNQIDKALDVGTFEAKTQGFADKFWISSKGDLGGALAMARDMLSGKEEDAVVLRLKSFAQEQQAIKELENKKISDQAWAFAVDGKKIPTTLQTLLLERKPEELRQIKDWIDQQRRKARSEAEQGPNYGLDKYYDLRRMAMDDPAAFTSLDLRRFAPYMSKGQMEGLIDIQGSINKNDVKAMESSRVIKTTLTSIKSEIAAAGIDMTPKEGTPQALKTNQFMGALTQALDQATKEKGKPLTDDEAKRIGMSMLREGIEQGSGFFGFFQSKKRGYEIATDANIKPGANFIVKKYDDIPVNVRQELLRDYVGLNPSALKRDSSGKYIMTDEAIAAIERAYTRGVNQGKFK
jgi:hypothetical protein